MWKSTVLISYSGMLVLGYSNTSCLTLFRILYSSSSSYENCILPLLTYNYKNACSFCQTAIYDFFIQNDCRYEIGRASCREECRGRMEGHQERKNGATRGRHEWRSVGKSART